MREYRLAVDHLRDKKENVPLRVSQCIVPGTVFQLAHRGPIIAQHHRDFIRCPVGGVRCAVIDKVPPENGVKVPVDHAWMAEYGEIGPFPVLLISGRSRADDGVQDSGELHPFYHTPSSNDLFQGLGVVDHQGQFRMFLDSGRETLGQEITVS